MKKTIILTFVTALFCLNLSATSLKDNRKIKKEKAKKTVSKPAPSCETHSYPGGSYIYICTSSTPCQPSFNVICMNDGNGGSTTISYVNWPGL